MSRFHGILVIDKPAGWTSHDVVGWTRRWLGQKKVGHAGTLDPAATGVLPVVAGDATRFVEYLSEATKSYVADITLGIETDSADIDGVVTVDRRPVSVSEDQLVAALGRFLGEIEQRPPMHSAIKVGGRRLYDLARRGETVDVPVRRVTISQLELLRFDGEVATVAISCSKGTYVRSIARDVGHELGVGGYLSNLVRVRTGPFELTDAWAVDELREHDPATVWHLVAERADAQVVDLPAFVMDEHGATEWSFGRALITATTTVGPIRVYGPSGDFLGIGANEADGDRIVPRKVLQDAA